MNLSAADRSVLSSQLNQLAAAVEELLSSGLTTAGPSTRETFDVTFREASRLKLLRVASTLRAANEEIGRYIGKQPDFSAKRLVFFLNRAWLLARGLLRALENQDAAEWDRLLWTPNAVKVDRIEVVTLGVSKRVAKGSFCAFEFRLRRVDASADADRATRLVWSCIFPMKPGAEIPPEAFLQLPQKQKFKAAELLEGRIMTVTNVLMSTDEWGNGRVTLTDTSTLTRGDRVKNCDTFSNWSAELLLKRIRKHDASPFDLEVELQDEIVLHDWTIGKKRSEERDGQHVFPLTSGGLEFDAVVSSGPEGQSLVKRLTELAGKTQKTPLFGLLHFDRCRLILQPLSLLGDDLELLTISNDKIDKAALLKTLKF